MSLPQRELETQIDAARQNEVTAKAELAKVKAEAEANMKATQGTKKVITDLEVRGNGCSVACSALCSCVVLLQKKVQAAANEKDAAVRQLNTQWERKEKQRAAEEKKRVAALEKQLRQAEVKATKAAAAAAAGGGKGGKGAAVSLQENP